MHCVLSFIFFCPLNDSINSILPHLYRDPANASTDCSLLLFLMNDSKATSYRKKKEQRQEARFTFFNDGIFKQRRKRGGRGKSGSLAQHLLQVCIGLFMTAENKNYYPFKVFSSVHNRGNQGLWGETRVPSKNPCQHEDNLQTPHRKAEKLTYSCDETTLITALLCYTK